MKVAEIKTVLLLGSNSDVGKAIAYRFAKEGFDLFLATRSIDLQQEALSADLSIRFGVQVHLVHFDALNTGSHLAFYNSLPLKPDIVISVFGYLGNHDEAKKNFEEAAIIINTNFIGNVSILGIAANRMEQDKSGAILCISSVAGDRGRKSNYLYGSSKAGLTSFLSGLRGRLAESGVQVTSIIPGFIKTKMIEGIITSKILTTTPEHVADAVWIAWKKKKNIVYVSGIWRYVMLIFKHIPESIFKKLNF